MSAAIDELRRRAQEPEFLESINNATDTPKPPVPGTFEHDLATALAEVQAKLGTQKTSKRAPLFGVDAVDLLTQEFPPEQWLVKGLLTRVGVGMLAGEPKAGVKTWGLVEIALAIATGTKAFGEFYAEAGRVAMFFAEDHKQSVRNRERALLAGAGRSLSRGRLTLQPRGEFLDVLSDEDLAWVVASARKLGPLDLLILDPLRDIHSGEEDKSDSMREVMRRLRLLGELLGCAVLVSHHTVKATKDSDKRSTWQNIRGSSAIRGSLDMGLMVNALKSEGPAAFKVSVETMAKSARSAGTFVLELAIDDDAGGEATSARWMFSRPGAGDALVPAADSGQATEDDDKVYKRVVELFTAGEWKLLSKTQLREAIPGVPDKRARDSLARLIGSRLTLRDVTAGEKVLKDRVVPK